MGCCGAAGILTASGRGIDPSWKEDGAGGTRVERGVGLAGGSPAGEPRGNDNGT
jgi:hypothetical protein